jgi:hypothetical protein
VKSGRAACKVQPRYVQTLGARRADFIWGACRLPKKRAPGRRTDIVQEGMLESGISVL